MSAPNGVAASKPSGISAHSDGGTDSVTSGVDGTFLLGGGADASQAVGFTGSDASTLMWITSLVAASCSRYQACRSLQAAFSTLQLTPTNSAKATSMPEVGDGVLGDNIYDGGRGRRRGRGARVEDVDDSDAGNGGHTREEGGRLGGLGQFGGIWGGSGLSDRSDACYL